MYPSLHPSPVNPPVLITGPVEELVSLDEAKAHLRVTHAAEDELIQTYIAAAMAHLDGWRGVLGRAIMPQSWKQELPGWGRFRLALPDASNPQITATDADGEPVTATSVAAGYDHHGWFVEADGPAAETVFVTFDCEMPDDKKNAVKLAVLLLVGHWYANREAVNVGNITAKLPLAFESLIAPLRWQAV